MAIDIYAACPCGSGQKFKWCCQPIYQDIERAYAQEADGQHEAALRIMDETVARHPGNPEIWGRRAQLLYEQGNVEESEKSLQKAFELNPKYAFGYLLQGMFRQHEGEIRGALILFRKAAELYDPSARNILGQIYSYITNLELKLQRPVAARAALKIAIHNLPGNAELRKAQDEVFGAQSQLPRLAIADYTFLSPQGSESTEAKAVWQHAVADHENVRLSDLAAVFDRLTQERPSDAAAWYNLGLAHAWLGDNRKAVQAIERFVEREPDEERAAAAFALAEVLRCSPGMEDTTDYLVHARLLQIQNPNSIVPMLEHFAKEQRLLLFKTEEDQKVLAGLITEKPALLTGAAGHASPLQGNILIVEGTMQLWHRNEEAVNRLRQEIQMLFPDLTAANVQERVHASGFSDILAEALVFPIGPITEDETRKRLHERMHYYFEDVWLNRPLIVLDHVAPINAVSDKILRRKLKGVLTYLRECATQLVPDFDFAAVLRKLGLEQAGAAKASSSRDIASMGTAELAGLNAGELNDTELESAYRTAYKLEARDQAETFARALVSRPAAPDAADRLPIFTFLIQKATQDGRLDDALAWVDQAEQFDCEKNEGRRRNDYELRRGQVHVKRKEADQAWDVFERLSARVPADLRVRAAATEGMLTLRQGARAVSFAEQGLAKAREQNDRDSEHHFQELLEAARKIG